MGSTFGKSDGSATNDLDAAGNVVATGTGVKTVADPNRGLNDGQMRNRKLAAIGGQTLGAVANPITSPMNNSGGPQQFTFANNQPIYSPPPAPSGAPDPPNPNQNPIPQGMQSFRQVKNPFYGY